MCVPVILFHSGTKGQRLKKYGLRHVQILFAISYYELYFRILIFYTDTDNNGYFILCMCMDD